MAKKGHPIEFHVAATYSTDKHPNLSYDSTIRGLVGHPEFSSSVSDASRTRSLLFVFGDEKSAKKAATRLKKKKVVVAFPLAT